MSRIPQATGRVADIRDPETCGRREDYWALHAAHAAGDPEVSADDVDAAHGRYLASWNEALRAGRVR